MTWSLRALVVCLALGGCSTQLQDQCDRVWLEEAPIRNCSERADTALWAIGVPVLLDEFESFYENVRPVASTVLIEIHDTDPEAYAAGLYLGYTRGDIIQLFIRPGDNVEPRYSALAHEWIHMWEHRVAGLSYEDWADGPAHFDDPARASEALSIIQDPENETTWEHPL